MSTMQKDSNTFSFLVLSAILALGILGGSYFISQGIFEGRANKPYITVKGLAERFVKADLAVWSISYSVAGNDITAINSELLRQQMVILQYLKTKGFKDNEISLVPIALTDRYASDYGTNKPTDRYLIKGGVMVRSKNVDLVSQASQTTGELVNQGIALGSNDNNPNPAYYYTQLNAIRPIMLSEATRSAKQVASSFANDTHSTLGTIRRAYQGIFEISSRDASGITDSNDTWQLRRDEQASIYKKIRLVSTIDYYLNS